MPGLLGHESLLQATQANRRFVPPRMTRCHTTLQGYAGLALANTQDGTSTGHQQRRPVDAARQHTTRCTACRCRLLPRSTAILVAVVGATPLWSWRHVGSSACHCCAAVQAVCLLLLPLLACAVRLARLLPAPHHAPRACCCRRRRGRAQSWLVKRTCSRQARTTQRRQVERSLGRCA
jgi:hypothetical protein